MDGLQDAKPIGWRARIGVIVPPSNTVNEAEFNRLKPDGVTYHFTRSPIHDDPAADGFVGLMNDVEIACDDMVRCNVDVIAYGCTSGSMAAPADLLIGKMKAVGKVEALSTAGSILKALGALGVNRVAMATPYTNETNEHEAHFLRDHGIEVVAHAGLGLNTTLECIQQMSRVAPAEVFEHAKSVDRPEAQAILICCTDFNSLDAIEPLEQALGKPVISSNICTFWNSLRTAGIEDKIEGYGRLLREH